LEIGGVKQIDAGREDDRQRSGCRGGSRHALRALP
jgi:hypothetical protein